MENKADKDAKEEEEDRKMKKNEATMNKAGKNKEKKE